MPRVAKKEIERGKTVIQSSKVTKAGYSFTKMQKRTFNLIVSQVQSMYAGTRVKSGLDANFTDLLEKTFVFSIAELTPGSNNVDAVKDSMADLAHKTVLLFDGPKKKSIVTFFDKIDIEDGKVSVRMTRSFYETMASITSGLTVFDLGISNGLPSVAAMRMYENLVRWKDGTRRYVTLDGLRDVLGCVERDSVGKVKKIQYPDSTDFERYVMQKVKKALDNPKYCSPYSFVYEPVKQERKIIGYYITVKLYPERIPEGALAIGSGGGIYGELDSEVVSHLIRCGWKASEIKTHAGWLSEIQDSPFLDIQALITDTFAKARTANASNIVGYMVASMKSEYNNGPKLF